MKASLGFVLALGLAGLQFVVVAAIIVSSYFSSERVLLEHARNLLGDVAANTIAHSRGFLRPAEGAADLASRLAQHEIIASDNAELLEKLLFQQLKTAPQFAGLFYGDEDGNFVYVMRDEQNSHPFRTKIITEGQAGRETQLIWRNDDFFVAEARTDPFDTFDPRTRPWYQGAVSTGAVAWTDPYIFYSSQRPGITVSAPVRNGENRVVGVIGVDIEIIAISKFLSELEIGETGRALIINHNGDVIAHPDPALLKVETETGANQFPQISQLRDEVAREAFADLYETGELELSSATTSSVTLDKERYVATAVPITDAHLPWTIAVYAPEADFIGPITDNRRNNFLIAILCACFTAAIGLVIANNIRKPIHLLGSRAADIANKIAFRDTSFRTPFAEIQQAHDTMMEAVRHRQETEVIFEQTFAESRRAMVRLDPQTGQILKWNDSLTRVLGYSLEDLADRNIVDVLDPNGDLVLLESWQRIIYGEAGKVEEFRALDKSGKEVWLSANMMAIHDDRGAPVHTVVTLDDITRIKEAEQEVRRLNNEIAHFGRVNAMGQLATGLAHELNQPLAAITQNADAARSVLDEPELDKTELKEILTDLGGLAER
ncbi:MAG: cache domain-containing protein, partial [Pseudomonadota bacterium]